MNTYKETAYDMMTVEHLGSDATEADLIAFRDACEAVLDRFDGDKLAATDYVWNDGNIRWEYKRDEMTDDIQIYKMTPAGIEVIACGECGSDDIEVTYGAGTTVLCHDCWGTSTESL